MDLIPAAVAERLITAARCEALWRGLLLGALAGAAGAAAVLVVILRSLS